MACDSKSTKRLHVSKKAIFTHFSAKERVGEDLLFFLELFHKQNLCQTLIYPYWEEDISVGEVESSTKRASFAHMRGRVFSFDQSLFG